MLILYIAFTCIQAVEISDWADEPEPNNSDEK